MAALFCQSLELPAGISSLNCNTEEHAVTDVVGRAFAGDQTHDPEFSLNWCLVPELADRSDPQRVEITRFFLSFTVRQHGYWTRGLTLGVRGGDGELQAVCVCRKLDRAKPVLETLAESSSYVYQMASSIAYGRVPKLLMDDAQKATAEALERRSNPCQDMLKTMHKDHADAPHWYVAILAVDPEHQGKGLGAKLIRAVSAMADKDGLPCYLECSGPRNKAVYEHLGYEEKGVYALIDEGVAGQVPFRELFAMVRPCVNV